MTTMTDEASTAPATAPARPKWGIGERMADAALTMLIATLCIRFAFAFGWRGDGQGESESEWDAELVLDLFAALLVLLIVVAVLAAWALLIAPLVAALMLRPLRRRSPRVQVIGVGAAALLTAILPLALVYLVYYAFGEPPDSALTAAWGLAALAAVTPIVVFFAGKVLARTRIAQIVVYVLALASVIHLVFWLDVI